MKYTVAHAVIDILIARGVEIVFGVPGGANGPFTDALADRSIRYVNTAHECGAVFMAMGYARSTGKIPAVFTTAGPGVTNALTGLVSAHHEKIAMIVIAGEVSTRSFGRGAVQESNDVFNAVNTVAPVTRFSRMVYRADGAAALAHCALDAACSHNPGPVFLSVPFDIAISDCEPSGQPAGSISMSTAVDHELCEQAAQLLKGAKKPLLLAGAGCRRQRDAITGLSLAYGLPVATTPKGKGAISEDHPNALGVIGLGGHPSANQPLEQGIDVLLAMGTSLDDLATNAWTDDLQPSQGLIHVNDDASVFGRGYPCDFAIVSRVEEFCQSMVQHAPRNPPLSGSAGRIVHPPSAFAGALGSAGEHSYRLDGPLVAALIDRYAPEDAVFTADMGEHLVCAIHHIAITHQRDWFISLGFGAMGSGPCSAVGWQMAEPDRRVFSLVGDGGFLMLNELTTAVLEKVPVTYVVFNDARLNMVHHGQQGVYGRTQAFAVGEVDYAAYAKSCGARGVVVKTAGQLGDALLGPPPTDGPLLIDARIDPAIRVPATIDRAKGLRATMQGAHS